MTLRQPACAVTLQNNLNELKRRKDLESLRIFLIHEHCFPQHCDTTTAIITMEELKKLARAWKLHERRNFWKMHSQKTEMVTALLQHIDDTEKLSALRAREQLKNGGPHTPVPPRKPKPSRVLHSEGKSPFKMENICGFSYFNRERSTKLLLSQSRFHESPRVENAIPNLVDRWRGEDFNMLRELKDDIQHPKSGSPDKQLTSQPTKSSLDKIALPSEDIPPPAQSVGVTRKKLTEKERLAKHRNLAAHLANFSRFLQSNASSSRPIMDMKTVQTFINVAETDDTQVAVYCIIALSNISAFPTVRSLLFEMNALHKAIGLMPLVKDSAAIWAASILFYYFSCDAEIEDRVFNVCMSSLQQSINIADEDMAVDRRMLNLYTLNNLLPSIVDRMRITEMILPFIRQQCAKLRTVGTPRRQRARTPQTRPGSKVGAGSRPGSSRGDSRPGSAVVAAMDSKRSEERKLENTTELNDALKMFLTVIFNTSSFANTHGTMLNHRVVDALADIGFFAALHQDGDLAFELCRVMMGMVVSSDLVRNTESADFAGVFMDLLKIRDDRVVHYSLRGLTIMSSSSSLLDCVCDSGIISAIASVIKDKEEVILPKEKANDIAKFLCNISQYPLDPLGDLSVHRQIAEVTLQLLRKQKLDMTAKSIAIRALQNVFVVESNCDPVWPRMEECVKILLDSAKRFDHIGSVYALYNLSCSVDCSLMLVHQKVHQKVLDMIHTTGNHELKSALLEVLVRIVGNADCVNELLQQKLIQVLYGQIRQKTCPTSVWYDCSRMLLAVVATADNLHEDDKSGMINILKLLSRSDQLDRRVGTVVAVVLAFMSADKLSFNDANVVVRATLPFIDDEMVQHSISTTLYNISCDEASMSFLVEDVEYLNTMIYIMRNSRHEVQLIICETMRTLCVLPKTTRLLLKHELLPDLVVVALLRTTSVEIKTVCIETFYNMLCHRETRLELIKGDLWWAMMRLGKTDNEVMRNTFACALFYLSCDADSVEPLRSHHVIVFLKEIASHPSCSLSMLEMTMRAVLNMYNHMKTIFNLVELGSIVFLCTAVVEQSEDIVLISSCLAMLLKSIQDYARERREQGEEDAFLLEGVSVEFVNVEFVLVLDNFQAIWSRSGDCRLYIASLLGDLSSSRHFTQAFSLCDLQDVLRSCYSACPSGEVGECIVKLIYRYAATETEETLSALPDLLVWTHLQADVLGCARWTPLSSNKGGLSNDDAQNIPSDDDVRPRNIVYSMEVKTMVVAVIAADADVLTKVPDKFPKVLMEGLLIADFIFSPATSKNVLYTIQALSAIAELADNLFDCGVVKLLRKLINFVPTAKTVSKLLTEDLDETKILQVNVCTSALRNMSLHRNVLRKLAAVQGSQLDLLITDLMQHCTDENFLDIAILLCSAINYMLRPDFTLRPIFVLETVKTISSRISNAEIDRILKCIVDVVLEKFSFGMGVDPSFVQSMFVELVSTGSTSVAGELAKVGFRHVENICWSFEVVVDKPLSRATKVSVNTFAPAEGMWATVTLKEKKNMTKEFLMESSSQPRSYNVLEQAEPLLFPVFSKIVREYPPVEADISALLSAQDDEEFNLEPIGAVDFDDSNDAEMLQEQIRRISLRPDMPDILSLDVANPAEGNLIDHKEEVAQVLFDGDVNAEDAIDWGTYLPMAPAVAGEFIDTSEGNDEL